MVDPDDRARTPPDGAMAPDGAATPAPARPYDGPERRDPAFKRCFYGASIVWPGAWLTFPCTIVGISDTGARILLSDENAVLPHHFTLRWNDRDLAHACEQVRRRGHQLDVRWDDPAAPR